MSADLHFSFTKKKSPAEKNGCKEKKGFKDFFIVDKSKYENSVSRDWAILFCISITIFVLLFIWSAFIFRGTFSVKENAGNLEAAVPETTIQKGSLNRLVEQYEAKKKDFEVLKQTSPTIVDPSR